MSVIHTVFFMVTGNETFPLSKQVQAVALNDLLKIVKSLR
jgi:hypothetical protein